LADRRPERALGPIGCADDRRRMTFRVGGPRRPSESNLGDVGLAARRSGFLTPGVPCDDGTGVDGDADPTEREDPICDCADGPLDDPVESDDDDDDDEKGKAWARARACRSRRWRRPPLALAPSSGIAAPRPVRQGDA
jgi:hypothetical protein